MTASLNHNGPFFAGTVLTISCIVKLDPGVNNDELVTVDWNYLHNTSTEGRFSVTSVTRISNSSYLSTLIISPLADQDDGTCTCIGTIIGGTYLQLSSNSSSVTINVMSKC